MKIPRLFGHDARTNYLVGIAMHGPIEGRPLGRLLNVDPARLPELFRHFRTCGVVSRDERGSLIVYEDYPAYAELVVFLRALGGERVIVIPDEAPRQKQWPRSLSLFGTPARTRVLVALAGLGSANIEDLRFAAWCSRSTTRSILRFFEAEGVVRVKREAPEIVAELDQAFRQARLLLELLNAMGRGVPSIANRVAAVKRDRAAIEGRSSGKSDGPATLPFGTRVQSRVLLAVARGPVSNRVISDETGLSKNTVRATIDALEEYGLIVSTNVGRGAGAARWSTLNDLHPLSAPLRDFAAASFVSANSRLELPPKNLPSRRRVTAEELPGSRELRSRILFDVLEAKSTSPAAAAKRLRIPRAVVNKWARDLDSAGLIRYGVRGGRLALESIDITECDARAAMALISATSRFMGKRRAGSAKVFE
jgi:transposase